MATSRNVRVEMEAEKLHCGLVACGSCGNWDFAVDETTSGPDRWFAQIEGPSVYFSFEIPSLEIIDELYCFLSRCRPSAKQQAGKRWEESTGTLVIGKDKQAPVTLVHDDEYDDRFFLVVGPTSGSLARYTLTGGDLKNILSALEQVREDLKQD